jgi:hypothetical protein
VSGATGQPFQAKPLLRPETTPIVSALLHLIAYASRVVTPVKAGSTKQHVPPGQENAKIVAAQTVQLTGLIQVGVPDVRTRWRFVSKADAVVPPVKVRADPQTLADGAKK